MVKTPIPIKRIAPVSKGDFFNNYIKRSIPIVFTGLAARPEALQLWSMDYITEYSHNTTRVNAVPFKNWRLDMDEKKSCSIQRISISEAMKAVNEINLSNDAKAIVTPLDDLPLEIQKQCPPYNYCADGSFLRTQILIGPTGTVTPLHQDLFENLYTTVVGCKQILLFEPSAPVYRCSPFSKLPNFAQVNPENPDYSRFKKFQQAQPYIVDLQPGETLYIPALWWHHLRNTKPTIAVSFWWGYSWRLFPAWVGAVYRKLANHVSF